MYLISYPPWVVLADPSRVLDCALSRTSSQKPPEELLASFRQSFPEVRSSVTALSHGRAGPVAVPVTSSGAGAGASTAAAGTIPPIKTDEDNSHDNAGDSATRKLRGGYGSVIFFVFGVVWRPTSAHASMLAAPLSPPRRQHASLFSFYLYSSLSPRSTLALKAVG
jgi:hypothetical protein